jgi:drug/metabolite transporter (DMT)-like permease
VVGLANARVCFSIDGSQRRLGEQVVSSAKAKRGQLASIALVSVAFAWGASFVLMKDTIETQPIWDFLGTRFVVATLVMIAVRPKVIRLMRGPVLANGAILGLLLAAGYYTQTVGLQLTTAAITGFITGLYVVMVPLMAFLFFKQKIGLKVVLGVALSTIGLAFISINGVSFDLNQLWVVACAFFYALHIIGLSIWSPGRDPYALTVVQLGTMAVANMIFAVTDGYQGPVGFNGWFTIVFTAVLGTALGFFVQTWAQGIMDPSRVAIILTLEVVFAAGISVAAGQETLLPKTLLGGILMLGAMMIVEWPSRRNKTDLVPLEPMQH